MSDSFDAFYVKFKVNKKTDVLRNFIYSFDEDLIQKWLAEKPQNKIDDQTSSIPSKSTFSSITVQFQTVMETYLVSTPFLMSFLPQQIDRVADQHIRGFAKEVGELQSSGDFETYTIPVEHFNKLHQRSIKMKALRKGALDIPSMFFSGMISEYDAFIGNILKIIFLTKTEILSASERNISFKDLIDAGSIETLRDKILEKEIETVMRKSHSDQISYLEEKLCIPLTKGLKIWPEFIEIFERRNLLAHTSGIVSSQYLNVCKNHKYDVKSTKIGDQLEVPQEYYLRSVEVITEFGIKLSQVVWRKLIPSEIDSASRHLNLIVFDLLQNERYSLAENISNFGLRDMKKQGSEESRKMLTVNHALSLKFGGKPQEVESALAAEDWSASRIDFQICVAAVRGDMDQVVRLLKPALDSGEIDKNSIRDWPAFKEVRDQPDFLKRFHELTGEQPYPSKEVSEDERIDREERTE